MAHANLFFIEAERRLFIVPSPLRTIVVRVGEARVMYSPGSVLSEEQMKSAGMITDIIAPNLFHTDGAVKAAGVFPQARLWGPDGIRKKRPKLTWSILGQDAWPYGGELELIPLAGMRGYNESVLYHAPSRSLIVADLFFNIQNARGFGAWLVLGMSGTYRRFAVSRLFMLTVKDKAAFSQSMKALAAKQIDTIIPVHGEILSASAGTQLRTALDARGVTV